MEPHFATDITLDGKDAKIWAVQQATMFHYRIAAGRWYTPAEEQARAHVAVIEQDIAQATGTRLGDTITVQTSADPASFRVIGISPQQQENGTALFVPLTTMNAIVADMPASHHPVLRAPQVRFRSPVTTRWDLRPCLARSPRDGMGSDGKDPQQGR